VTGSSLIIEIHGWRGIAHAGGGLLTWTTLGFITFAWCPFLLTERLREMIDKLKNVAGESRGFVEMACVGEDRIERVNGGKPLHVPSKGEK
jgi:hypothetical protein